MGLRHLERSWNSLAEADPLWAILTWPDKSDRRWDLEEFLATGREEIEVALRQARPYAPALQHDRALDFGCGVGRLSQALAAHFDEVHGVDIAARMIEEARRVDQHHGTCVFHVNETADLGLFPDRHFDLVYSTLTLQHMPPALMRGYIGEFCRVLGPGGVAVFQVAAAPRRRRHPVRLVHLAGRAYTWTVRWWRTVVLRRPSMDMFGIADDDVRTLVRQHGCDLAAVEDNGMAGPEWTSHQYYVVRI